MATKATEREDTEGDTEALPKSDGPLLDLTDAAVKRMIKLAKKRGYVTYDELNQVLPSEEFTSEQIEDVLGQLSEMGINVVEAEEAEEGRTSGAAEGDAGGDDDEGEGGEVVEQAPPRAVAIRETATKEPTDRTDDPVRMYLREMGSVELLSREGEIAIAKRIEAGRELMIGALCESPLTFEALTVWRDELNEGKVLLRDIIDLEAMYGAGPDGQPANIPPPVGPDGKPLNGVPASINAANGIGAPEIKKPVPPP
ncbi:MAG: RNA polymerase sigma factor region1.1 domain-containing protein, partial [Microvirga sp.]